MSTATVVEPMKVKNPDGTCVVRECDRFATAVRTTRHGFFLIHYCADHERAAQAMFGAKEAA